ncbi:beta-N-acetylhexosaminidase, partial [Paenibacillus validus]|nr:beta-N-acetylhexosaminidase [Paenibacillus validus]
LHVLDALKQAAADGTLTEERLNTSVSRILALKKKYGLSDKAVSTPDPGTLNAAIRKLLEANNLRSGTP